MNVNHMTTMRSFEKFVRVVNDQSIDIENARIEAIPIVVYHGFVQYDNILENKNPTDTSLSLFEQEMKYLHDEGFEVLLMRDIHYDQKKTILCTQSVATKMIDYPINRDMVVKIDQLLGCLIALSSRTAKPSMAKVSGRKA